jgi:hypothetical protein
MRSSFVRGAALTFALALAGSAHADPSPQDRAASQSFFDRGMALMKDGKFADACPLLEESQRLDPAQGTQFQLAKCFEGQGRVASAWAQYVDVADASKAAGNADREKVARAAADKVAPRIPKLSIVVAPANGDAIEVKRDGVAVRKIQWGQPVPVDPGKHVISASAAGKTSFDTTIDVKEGGSAEVKVPELAVSKAPPPVASAGPAPATTTAPPAAEPPSSTQRTVGLVVGGVGVVAFGTSVVLALSAKSKANDTGANCVGDRCNQAGIDTRDSAMKLGTVATVVGTVGLLAVAGGVTLWLTAPKSSDAATLGISPTLGGLAATGRF